MKKTFYNKSDLRDRPVNAKNWRICKMIHSIPNYAMKLKLCKFVLCNHLTPEGVFVLGQHSITNCYQNSQLVKYACLVLYIQLYKLAEFFIDSYISLLSSFIDSYISLLSSFIDSYIILLRYLLQIVTKLAQFTFIFIYISLLSYLL